MTRARTRVGIVFDLDDTWLGGINYFRNLVTAVYQDPDRSIDIVIFTGRHAKPSQLAGFPPVEVVRTPFLDHNDGFWSKLRWRSVKYLRRDFLLRHLIRRHRIEVLSHFAGWLGRGARVKVVAWIPDFQHVHLPDHFTAPEMADRKRRFLALTSASDGILLSSGSALADLVSLYPAAAARAMVLRFVPEVEIDDSLPTREEVEARHGFSGPFIHLPNQYWAHKNHRVVIEAIALLRDRGRMVQVVSTGAQRDYRNPDHFATLCKRIDALSIGAQYLRLGIVPYRDLLALMRDAVCLVNPSRFEGWSTTVEEARAMGKPILLSDIPVHREQSPPLSTFFPVDDAEALADAMWAAWQRGTADATPWSGLAPEHAGRRQTFAREYQSFIARAVGGDAPPLAA